MTIVLHELVTRQGERRPDAAAVVLGAERLTYGELDRASSQVSRLLAAAGCRRGDRVFLLTPKTPAAIAGLVGILKAGGVYVPIDPAGPASRVRTIMEACEGRAVLAGGPVAGLLDEVLEAGPLPGDPVVGWLGPGRPAGRRFAARFGRDDWSSAPDAPPGGERSTDDPAYILFTSGSTGTPKGVVITHANVLRFVEWAVRYFGIAPEDRTSSHAPLHFDLSVFDLFGAFAAGASVYIVPTELNLLPHRLADFIRAAGLTQWFSVPSLLAYMAKFNVVRHGDFPALRRLLWAGEVFSTPSLIYWMTRLPHVRFTNLYGPTETTVSSSYYTVPEVPRDDRVQIPIGRACDGEELLVLDEALRPVPPGEVGDLYIHGVGLSPGYWRDPERTRAAFLPDPRSGDARDRIYRTGDIARVGDDGLVYFLGRRDDQVKSRGHRIELGEIEAALDGLDYLREGVVVALPTDDFEGVRLACGYVAAGAAVTPARLRADLARRVPPYMVPTQWLALDALPRNANGKVDRRRLRELLGSGADRDRRAI